MKAAFALLFLPAAALADQGETRQVVGGDILYTASAASDDSTAAAFLADQAAIHAVISECKLPSRDIKVFKKGLEATASGYRATSTAGISMESCDEARRARDPSKLTSPQIAADQAAYDKHMKKKLGLDKKPDFDLKSYLGRHFDKTDAALDAIARKLDALEQRQPAQAQPERVIVVQQPSPASGGDGGACKAMADSLMAQAMVAANENYPRGNLAQGRASELWNQAAIMSRRCH
jgi:hypothetical protein